MLPSSPGISPWRSMLNFDAASESYRSPYEPHNTAAKPYRSSYEPLESSAAIELHHADDLDDNEHESTQTKDSTMDELSMTENQYAAIASSKRSMYGSGQVARDENHTRGGTETSVRVNSPSIDNGGFFSFITILSDVSRS